MMHGKKGAARLLAAAMGIAAAIAASPAQATEGGASLYLLGSGGPGVAEMPPLEGVYFDNMIYVYSGDASASGQFVVGGNVVAGLEATIVADFASTLWVPSTNVLGGTLAVGGIVAVGAPMINVDAILTGPLGNQFAVSRRDSDIVVGDPVATAALGWKVGEKTHVQVSTLVNIPVGTYRENQLANLAFHRWIVRCSSAAGVPGLAPIDVLVLHAANHRGREKTQADICLMYNVEDTHLVTYAVKKLQGLKLVETGRRGKEKTVRVTSAGAEICARYREVREALLVASVADMEFEDGKVSALAALMRALSGQVRSSGSLT